DSQFAVAVATVRPPIDRDEGVAWIEALIAQAAVARRWSEVRLRRDISERVASRVCVATPSADLRDDGLVVAARKDESRNLGRCDAKREHRALGALGDVFRHRVSARVERLQEDGGPGELGYVN